MHLLSFPLIKWSVEKLPDFCEGARRLRTLSKCLPIVTNTVEIGNNAQNFTLALQFHQEVSLIGLKVSENEVSAITD